MFYVKVTIDKKREEKKHAKIVDFRLLDGKYKIFKRKDFDF